MLRVRDRSKCLRLSPWGARPAVSFYRLKVPQTYRVTVKDHLTHAAFEILGADHGELRIKVTRINTYSAVSMMKSTMVYVQAGEIWAMIKSTFTV